MARKRIRVADKPKKRTPDREEKLLRENAVLQFKIMAQIQNLKDELEGLAAQATGCMEALGIETFAVEGAGVHTYKQTKTNDKNVVRPDDFLKVAGDNAFWASCQIPIGEARKHLGEKELAKCVTTTKGRPGPHVYKFK